MGLMKSVFASQTFSESLMEKMTNAILAAVMAEMSYSSQNVSLINSLPDDKIVDSSKLKEFADDNFKFDENGRKFSKRIENAAGKGEIACYK